MEKQLDMEERLKIPKIRIGVIIGKGGKTKQNLEHLTQTNIDVDSKDGTVTIRSTEKTEDPLSTWKTKTLVQAMARGFSEKKAFLLLDDNYYLDIIELGGNEQQNRRVRSRVIGERGKTRRIIEQNTGANLAIFGDTISFIGEVEEVNRAKEAVRLLLKGVPHGVVYRHLQAYRFREKLKPPELWQERADIDFD